MAEDYEEVGRLDQVVGSELDYYESMNKDDENRLEEAKILCQMIDKTIEEHKLQTDAWEVEFKLDREKEIQQLKIDADNALQTLKHDQEMELQLMKQEFEKDMQQYKWECEYKTLTQEKQLKEQENDIKKKQMKADFVRTAVDFGKCVLTIGAFVIFERQAHIRDTLDVIDRDSMHIRKNPLFGKLRPY